MNHFISDNHHLSQTDRFVIERMLMAGSSFRIIAEKLGRHPSTISREIRNHRNFINAHTVTGNDCVYSVSCMEKHVCDDYSCFSRCAFCKHKLCKEFCSRYINGYCAKLDRPPYVCNICSKRGPCRLNHAYYNAHQAHAMYLRTLSSSRRGIHATPERLHQLDNLITPLLKMGQPLSHIFATHADEIGCSRKTVYNYVEAHAFTAKNIDLPRKVRYKRRKKQNCTPKIHYRYREGRTYQDYQNYIEQYPESSVVEMDTVKGSYNVGKVLLTMVFCKFNFMLIFIMPDATQESVIGVFNRLTSLLGLNLFRKIFPLILTDNGVEFKDVEALEYTPNGDQRTRLFYCDPQASWQKPHVEKNHEFIRRVLPKSKSFNTYTQKDITLLANHINSLARDSFNGICPFELAAPVLGKKLLDSLELELVAPDKVHLTPALMQN